MSGNEKEKEKENGNEWIMLDTKLTDKMSEVIEKLDVNDKNGDQIKRRVDEIQLEIKDLRDELVDVKNVFKDWKDHLERSRQERLNVLEEIKGFLKENRELYMSEFVKEANKLCQISENNKKLETKLETKLSPKYQLRRDNRSWRQFNIMGYRSSSSGQINEDDED